MTIAKLVEFIDLEDADIGGEPVSLKFYSPTIETLVADVETGIVWGATFVVGNESGNERSVHIAVTKNGVAVTNSTVMLSWVSSSAGGQPIVINDVVTVGPGRVLSAITASNPVYFLVTNSSGQVTISLEDSATETIYLNLVMPDGRVVSSSGIAFA